MNQSQLEKALRHLSLGQIEYYDKIGSTNDRAAELAIQGAPHMTLVAANEQAKGRGRAGRNWFTPPDSALAFSLVLRGSCLQAPERVPGLAALAICDALDKLVRLQVEIKWPNDILIEGKKVCGILAESEWIGKDLQYIILGIGINVTPTSVPPLEDLLFPAACLADFANEAIDRLELLAAILKALVEWQEKLITNRLLAAWEDRLAYRGQEMQIVIANQPPIKGILEGLDMEGNLQLQIADGTKKTFSAGEIRLRPLVDTEAN